jgi:hypothetical protein
METLVARTERESTALIDPVVDRRYIIDSAIRTGAQGAPFESSDVDLALKNLFKAESENKQHRWFDLASAEEFLRAHEESNYTDNAKFEELLDMSVQIPEGKTMDDLRAVLKTSADLTENIIKIRWWLDNGTDALINEYAGDDEQKKSEVIVGLSALSGFLSDYFTLMEMIQHETGSAHEHTGDCSDERVERKPSLPSISEDSNEIALDEELAEQGQEDVGFFQDEDFDDSDEISNLCFTIAQVASEDRTFRTTLDIAFGVTSLIIKDFENWVGAEFVSEDEDDDEDENDDEEEDEEEAPELVE